MPVAFNLNFTTTSCTRCGSKQRVVGLPCPDCGHPGRANEVNSTVTRRRQGIRAAMAYSSELTSGEDEPLPYYLSRNSWRALLGRSLEGAVHSLASLASQPLKPELQMAAGEAMWEVRRLESHLRSIPARRPYVQDLDANRRAAGCLVEMLDDYIDAFGAASPAEAQSLGAKAQAQIDAATALLDASENERVLGERLGEATPNGFFEVAIDVLLRAHPGKNLLEIDADLRQKLSKRLNREIANGQGVSYAIAEVFASASLDVERFRSVVVSATGLFDTSERLRGIAREPEAVSTLLRARNAILESTGAFAAAMSSATSDEARLRRTVNLYRELFEDAGAPLFAWFLRVSEAKPVPISALMRENSTTLLEAINSRADLAAIFVGADKNIRTAASHGLGYKLVGEEVVFNLRSFDGTMTVEVIIDLLLALIESLLAAFWVLDNELSIAGVEGHTSASSLMGFSMLAVAEELLRILGAEVLSAEEGDDSWKFTLGKIRRSDPYLFAVALAANPPSNVKTVSIECPDLPIGVLEIPKTASQQFVSARNSHPLALVSANLIFLRDSRLNGRTALTIDHLSRTACIAAVALLHQGQKEAVSLLRQCMRLAADVGAMEVVDFGRAVLEEWRNTDPRRLKKLAETMRQWNTLAEPKPPLVRTTRLVGIRRETV